MCYYLVTSFFSVATGVFLVTTIRPGELANDGAEKASDPEGEDDPKKRLVLDVLLDMGRNLLPPNALQATMQSYRTTVVPG